MSNIADLAVRIKITRELKGWTQSQLAERADLSVGTIARIETNVHDPNIKNVIKIANALGVTVNDLIYEGSHKTELINTKKAGDLTLEELADIIAKNSQSGEQSVNAKLGNLSKDETEIISLLRKQPHFTSSIIKLLTPTKPTPDNAVPLIAHTTTVNVPTKRKAK